MSTFPVTASRTASLEDAPRLEYPVYFSYAATYQVDLVTSPGLDNYPGRTLAIAVSVDDQAPQIVQVFTPATAKEETFLGKRHYKNAGDNARIMHVDVRIDAPGRHDLKITMVDPTIVVQKVIVHDSALPESYFGPPSRPRNPAVQ
jgi:hypothetical protein